METDGNKGDEHGERAGKDEHPPAYRGLIGEALQPFVHGPPGNGDGDKQGNDHQFEEVGAQEPDDASDAGAEDLAHPDLLAALFGAEGREAKEAQAGDEDGYAGKGIDDIGEGDLGLVLFLDGLIEEGVFEGGGTHRLAPDSVD